MILVDTSVWVNHLRAGDGDLAELLHATQVLTHPFVIGEVALGHLHQRKTVLDALSRLPKAVVATDDEVLRFIEGHALFGRGVGYIDAHLLTSTRLTPGVSLWSRDKRLRTIAAELGVEWGGAS